MMAPDAVAGLVVYTREGCHLCEEMITELAALLEGRGLGFAVLDVDADEATRARFGLKVPVLARDGEPLCSGRLDPDVLEGLA